MSNTMARIPWWAGWSMRLWSGLRAPEFTHLAWFNLGVGCIGLSLPWRFFRGYGLTFWPWNAFARRFADGTSCWGFGLLQIGRRHLIYISEHVDEDHPNGGVCVCVGFVWLRGRAP